MRYEITKRFKFEAGHRVWKQNLLSGKGAKLMGKEIPPNPCLNIHGHSYKVEVTVGSDTLNEQEMVIDFYHIKGTGYFRYWRGKSIFRLNATTDSNITINQTLIKRGYVDKMLSGFC